MKWRHRGEDCGCFDIKLGEAEDLGIWEWNDLDDSLEMPQGKIRWISIIGGGISIQQN